VKRALQRLRVHHEVIALEAIVPLALSALKGAELVGGMNQRKRQWQGDQEAAKQGGKRRDSGSHGSIRWI
jgi:hypothetical protein